MADLGNGHDQSESRVVKGHGNALGQLRRVVGACHAGTLRAKNLDHADHRAEEIIYRELSKAREMADAYSREVALGIHDDARMAADYALAAIAAAAETKPTSKEAPGVVKRTSA
mgnify:CR=1 FL=1